MIFLNLSNKLQSSYDGVFVTFWSQISHNSSSACNHFNRTAIIMSVMNSSENFEDELKIAMRKVLSYFTGLTQLSCSPFLPWKITLSFVVNWKNLCKQLRNKIVSSVSAGDNFIVNRTVLHMTEARPNALLHK